MHRLTYPCLLALAGVAAPALKGQASSTPVAANATQQQQDPEQYQRPLSAHAASTQTECRASSPDSNVPGDHVVDGLDDGTSKAMSSRCSDVPATDNLRTPAVPDSPAASPKILAPTTQNALTGDSVRESEAAARTAARQDQLQEQRRPQEKRETDVPAAMRVKPPYGNMPALRDLYTQIPSDGGTLRRFGSEAFLFGTGNANQLPSDLPVGPDYVLGPGDQLVVNLWGSRSERLNLSVDRQGQLALPEAGTLVVNGMTIARAQEAVQRALNTQFKDEHAEISLGRLRTVRVYVVGDVQRPGAYDVNALSTPLSALYAAGGPTARGSLRLLRQMRNDKTVAQIDLYDFLLKGVRTGVERLQPGDTIVVPPVGEQVTVEGAVHRPAIYELNGEATLQQVLALAGGTLATANLQTIEVSRVEANTRRTMLSLQLPASRTDADKALAAFSVQNHDDVIISQILPYNQQAVYLAGHVFRPGQYAYRAGMTLTDVLHSYADLLPEPADRGQIIRLVGPDLHPETLPFQVHDVLLGNTPMALRPFDTVEVFGRYEADAPRVRIDGEVLHPGIYPMAAGMTVASLVELAGGLNRSAFREAAGLTSYSVVNGQSVEIGHTEVALQNALAGGGTANAMLKPGDVLSIRQMTGWRDIGSSVTLTGEVAHPGGYGIIPGERLSSVLRRAGGLQPDAYPEASHFARVQVQVLAEQARQDMIRRLETAPLEIKPGSMSASEEQQLMASLQAQRAQMLTTLRNRPADGRMVVNLSSDMNHWVNTPDDIVLRAGDTLHIPKRPEFILIGGQVYNPTAVTFVPGHDAGWYLEKGGGETRYGDRKRAYVLRADGSVVTHGGIGRGALHVQLRPGDAVVVPERFITGNQALRDVLASAQIVTSLALTAAVAGGL